MTSGQGNKLDEKLATLLLEREVEDFIVCEAALLDEWRLDEWLSLFTEDARYMVPSTELPAGDPKETLAIERWQSSMTTWPDYADAWSV
jgi:3-phenylpropionate/cinnamic acid dioxygenase small subunit